MTGFGRAEGKAGASHFTVEVKSVNHRYMDFRFRLPPPLLVHEMALAERLRAQFERGAFEINIKQKWTATGASVTNGTRYVVDQTALESLLACCQSVKKKIPKASLPSLDALLATNKVFIPVEDNQESESLADDLKAIFETAIKNLKKMREVEGTALKKVLLGGIQELVKVTEQISQLAAGHPQRIQEKLTSRIAQWKLSSSDPQRLEWEIAFYADRSDITEEIDRLRSHSKTFSSLLDQEKGIGRKLDFLIQELHREINTIGSKATQIELSRLTLDAKTIVEKLREQVQNVE